MKWSRSPLPIAAAAVLMVCAAGVSAEHPLPAERTDQLQAEVIERDRFGTIRDLYGLSVDTASDPDATSRGILSREDLHHPGWARPELRLSGESRSLTGRQLRYEQTVGGIPILGAGATIGLDHENRITTIHDRTVAVASRRMPLLDGRAIQSHAGGAAILAQSLVAIVRDSPEPGALGSELVYAWRVVVASHPLDPHLLLIDAETGKLLSDESLVFDARARLFDPNPVEKLNDPALRDQDNAATAVPPDAYTSADLQGLTAPVPLTGPNVGIIDTDSPFTSRADASGPLDLDRSDPRFEEVMAYYHIDRSQRHIQSLGYVGLRQIIPDGVKVDAHASTSDNSHYIPTSVPGGGALAYGDGGVDDAEDPDILLHEYGHAIHDAIAPGAFNGSPATQARALGEGVSDYWAFSSAFVASQSSGRDPFCIGDWDARCGGAPTTACDYPAGADCLRRVDSSRTMDDYSSSEGSGTEHLNGSIYASALRQFFMEMVSRYGALEGRRTADRVVLEGLFGMPPAPTFRVAARKLLEADALLNGAANSREICAAMSLRKILGFDECDSSPKGEVTLFQGTERGVVIPDASWAGVMLTKQIDDSRAIRKVFVQVEIEHPFRGDLEISLIAPNGTVVLLQRPLLDGGEDVRTTFGIDGQEMFAPLVGVTARGLWALRVADTRARDVGRVVSWSLLLELEGDAPMSTRETTTGESRFLPIVARVQGVGGIEYVSDLRILNGGVTQARLTAIFTPNGRDGSRFFSAIKLEVEPQQILTLDDLVRGVFRTAGLGSLEIRGDVTNLVITSRTYNRSEDATFGQLARAARKTSGITRGAGALNLIGLRNSDDFRTNVGASESDGQSGIVRFTFYDRQSRLLARVELPIAPFSQLQFAALGGRDGIRQSAFRAEVEVIEGAARVLAYAAVVDNRSGDPFYVEGRMLPRRNEASHIATIVHTDGLANTRWRSDVTLFNHSSERHDVLLTFLPADKKGVPSVSAELAPHELLSIDDVVATVFGQDGVMGQLRVESDLIRTTIAQNDEILVSSRTWTPGERGTYGQLVPGRGSSEALALGAPAVQLMQIELSESFRTNVGMAETAGSSARVRFRLLDAAGREIHRIDRDIEPFGHVQWSLAQSGAPPVSSGRISVEVIEGSGRVLPYATVVDNLSGDPIFVE